MVASEKADNDNQRDEKLEDVLRSIRNIIDNKNPSQNHDKVNIDSDSILELTDIVDEKDSLLSSQTFEDTSAKISDFKAKLDTHSYKNENNLDILITDLVRPLLKEWIDSNLPNLVEKVITEEIKKLVPKH